MNNENSKYHIPCIFPLLVCCFCSGVVQSACCIILVRSSEDELKTNHVYSSWLEFCWGSVLLLGRWAGDTLGYFPDILASLGLHILCFFRNPLILWSHYLIIGKTFVPVQFSLELTLLANKDLGRGTAKASDWRWNNFWWLLCEFTKLLKVSWEWPVKNVSIFLHYALCEVSRCGQAAGVASAGPWGDTWYRVRTGAV